MHVFVRMGMWLFKQICFSWPLGVEIELTPQKTDVGGGALCSCLFFQNSLCISIDLFVVTLVNSTYDSMPLMVWNCHLPGFIISIASSTISVQCDLDGYHNMCIVNMVINLSHTKICEPTLLINDFFYGPHFAW